MGRESYQAFLPTPLPPDSPLVLGGELLPDSHLFLYQYVRKEALLSSQIEGTQSSFSDLLLFEMDEAPSVPLDDAREVSNYIAAMNHGLERLGKGFPLSLRLLQEIHDVLLQGGRGAQKQPREFRRSQNWLGGFRPGNAVFVSPPPGHLMEILDPFERFLHGEGEPMSVLLKAGLAHVQFEIIHPFLDGNGRLGRLLITLILVSESLLREPLLYLSLYFKVHRSDYYDHLQRVRLEGDWESWLRFFLEGVFVTAQQAVETARTVLDLLEQDRERIRGLGRIASSCLQLHQRLQQKAIVNIPDSARALEINRTTISNCVRRLQELGMVREITGHRRNRLFVYDRYVRILSEGAEPL